jgi:hypothetical protein
MKIKEMIDDIKVKEIDDDMRDLGLDGPDSADDDNAGMDPEFKQTPMIIQVGKVIDSRGNPNPIKSVKADNGKEHPITPDQASAIKMFLTANYDIQKKRQFTKDVQNSETLGALLKGKSPTEMKDIFLKMYAPKGREQSAYA